MKKVRCKKVFLTTHYNDSFKVGLCMLLFSVQPGRKRLDRDVQTGQRGPQNSV